MSLSADGGLLGIPETRLPVDPAAALLASGEEPDAVAAAHPTSSLAWATLAERALAADRSVEAYAYARTGYHRGLDALRKSGWRGQGPVPWSHEPNRGFLRALEDELGPGIGAALARSAEMLREDADYLEDQARALRPTLGAAPWSAERLGELPRALRTRVWRLLAVEAGSGAGQLTAAHVESLDALLTSWHGQGPLHLPGRVSASRSGDQVTVTGMHPVG